MGNFYMESTQINYRRDEKLKTVDQKLQELSETSAIDTDIAPVFKSTNTYQPGDMVYYRNKLYVFNVEHTGTWAAADVTATDVTTELSSLKSGLTNNTNDLTTGSRTKNILPLSIDFIKANNTEGTWDGNVYTVNGITITFNTDSNGNITSITKSSDTPSATTVLLLYKTLSTFLPSATTKLNGCPTGGGNQTYKIDIIDSNASIYAVDYGASADGVTISDTSLVYDLMVRIVIYTGSTTEITFYPMIRLATASATYEPYIESINARLETLNSNLTNYTEVYKVTSDGVKTYAEMLAMLYDHLPNMGKYAILYRNTVSILMGKSSTSATFSRVVFDPDIYISVMLIKANGCKFTEATINANGVQYDDYSDTVVPADRDFVIVK